MKYYSVLESEDIEVARQEIAELIEAHTSGAQMVKEEFPYEISDKEALRFWLAFQIIHALAFLHEEYEDPDEDAPWKDSL